jgi:hypothetical protein
VRKVIERTLARRTLADQRVDLEPYQASLRVIVLEAFPVAP